MNITIKRILAWSTVVIWMLLIFSFSAQTAAESAHLSGQIIRFIARMLHPDFTTWTAQAQRQFINEWQHVARKAAHFTLYAGLGGLIMGMLVWLRHLRTNRARYAATVTVSAVYAMTDEFHQLFVAGRGAMANDVMLDTLGAAFGAIVVMSFIWLIRRRLRARKSHNVSKRNR